MKENYPSTPEEFNFQAELKVVSHWHWPEDKEVPRRKPGPRDDLRIKRAVKATLHKWYKDLGDLQSKYRTRASKKTYQVNPALKDKPALLTREK